MNRTDILARTEEDALLREEGASTILRSFFALRRSEQEDVEKVLSHGSTSAEEKDAAANRLNQMWLEMEKTVAKAPDFYHYFLYLTLIDDSGAMAMRNTKEKMEEYKQGLSKIDETQHKDSKERLEAMKKLAATIPFKVLPFSTLKMLGRGSLPIGSNSIVEYQGRTYTVVQIKRRPKCAHYGHRIVLRDIEHGDIVEVPHSIDSTHLKSRHIYAREGEVLCDSHSGAHGETWRSGCAKLDFNTNSRNETTRDKELRRCKRFIETNEDFPLHHPKQGLCQMLLREGQL